MKLNEFKTILSRGPELSFKLPDGSSVPAHFHLTEIGKQSRHFIDCGGTVRREEKANFQLWVANDFNHRLTPEKLLNIIKSGESLLGLNDEEIEIEYQSDTIGIYKLDWTGNHFELKPTFTDCLALDSCGIPGAKALKKLSQLVPAKSNSCQPGSGCC